LYVALPILQHGPCVADAKRLVKSQQFPAASFPLFEIHICLVVPALARSPLVPC
jgi:hypothetical protein